MRQHDAPVKGVHCAMQFYYVMLVKMFVSSRGCTCNFAHWGRGRRPIFVLKLEFVDFVKNMLIQIFEFSR